jgi:hypothetical protein
MLSGEESLALLESLRHSQLYRSDQHSYILYPDRKIPAFLEKNLMTSAHVSDLALVSELVKMQDKTLIVRDEAGDYHFSGHIRNIKDVIRSLDGLKRNPQFAGLVNSEAAKIEALFEEQFHHDEFTGRSGTFLLMRSGSIYWHMVSKLLLAVQETVIGAKSELAARQLSANYTDICNGLSFNKAPAVYGAFPTDPYSHTPKGRGAKQPGMTGMVKEEILTRQAELGLSIENGNRRSISGCWIRMNLPLLRYFLIGVLMGSTAKFYWRQVPGLQSVRFGNSQAEKQVVKVYLTDGSTQQIEGHVLMLITASTFSAGWHCTSRGCSQSR